MKSIKHFLAIALVAITTVSFAQKDNKAVNSLAIKGYDPVAYFLEAKAVKGDKSISTIQNGKTYYFASKNNKALFLKDRATYEPQYGGYCAYAMSENQKAPIQPEAFTIVDNKLYLNYNLETRTKWQKEQKERIGKADINWETQKNN